MITFILALALLGDTNEELLTQLGSAVYQERESAYCKIKNMEQGELIKFIKQHANHKDAEIKFRMRQILREVRGVLDDKQNYLVPSIWNMPNRLRYVEGYEQDIALEYYRKNIDFQLSLLSEGEQRERIRSLYSYVSLSKNSYGNMEVSRMATLEWLGDLVENGTPREEVIQIAKEMTANNLLFRAEYTADLPYDEIAHIIPGPILTKKIKYPGYPFIDQDKYDFNNNLIEVVDELQ